MVQSAREKAMEKPMEEENVKPSADTGATVTDIDTLREILFGQKAREHENRFDELKDLWTSSLDRTRADFKDRLTAFDTDTKREVRNIFDRIKLEHEAWQQRCIEISQKLQDLYEDHERKLKELSQAKLDLFKMYKEFLSEWVNRLESVDHPTKQRH